MTTLKFTNLVLTFSLLICSCGGNEKNSVQNEQVKDTISNEQASVPEFFQDSLTSVVPSIEISKSLTVIGENELTALDVSSDAVLTFPQGFTGYFSNVDAFKEDISQAPGYMLQLKSIDTTNKAVYFEPIKSAQNKDLKIIAKVPTKANVTSASYNSRSKSTVGFILGKASLETEDAYNFTFKEDLYADIKDSQLDTIKMNKLWKDTPIADRPTLYIVMQAYVVSYITGKYKLKKINVAASIPTEGGAIKIGSDCYVGGTNKEVIYKAKIVAFPLRNFVSNPNLP